MAKIIPIVTEEDSWRASKARAGKKFYGDSEHTPRRTGAEIEIARLKKELAAKESEVGDLKWRYDSECRSNVDLRAQVARLRNEVSYERNRHSAGSANLDIGMWRRILKLVHPDYHPGNSDAAEVTKAVIAMKPNR